MNAAITAIGVRSTLPTPSRRGLPPVVSTLACGASSRSRRETAFAPEWPLPARDGLPLGSTSCGVVRDAQWRAQRELWFKTSGQMQCSRGSASLSTQRIVLVAPGLVIRSTTRVAEDQSRVRASLGMPSANPRGEHHHPRQAGSHVSQGAESHGECHPPGRQ